MSLFACLLNPRRRWPAPPPDPQMKGVRGTDGGVDDDHPPHAASLETRENGGVDASRGRLQKAGSTSRFELVRSGNDTTETPTPSVGPQGEGKRAALVGTPRFARWAGLPGRQDASTSASQGCPSGPRPPSMDVSFSTLLSAHIDLPRAATWDPASLPPSLRAQPFHSRGRGC